MLALHPGKMQTLLLRLHRLLSVDLPKRLRNKPLKNGHIYSSDFPLAFRAQLSSRQCPTAPEPLFFPSDAGILFSRCKLSPLRED
jgi:hypothetical protein